VVGFVASFRFFGRAGLTWVFEYLGDRFGPVARLYGTASFIFLQLIRLAQVLFLMSLPMQFLTGASLEWVIVGAGVFVALYAVAGGMETVVWADAIQAAIKVLGGVLCLICVVKEMPGRIAQIVDVGEADKKVSPRKCGGDPPPKQLWTLAHPAAR